MMLVETTSRDFTLRVDRTAPSAPQGMELVGGGEWRRLNRFAVAWRKSPPDGGTAHVGVVYRLCPAIESKSVGTGCVTGKRSGSALDSLEDIIVPGTGVWRLQLALEDELGHVDVDSGATLENLRLDLDPPQLSFLPRVSSDPARVRLNVADEDSGLASATIEARRRGDVTWHSLSVEPADGGLTALLDDDKLPAGSYEVRGHAVDAVGNERTIALGNSDRIQLPVRQGTKIAAGVLGPQSKRRGSARLNSRPSMRYGARPQIVGRVADATGLGRSNVDVQVDERSVIPGAPWRKLTTVRTDGTGAFRYAAPRGIARTVRFRYEGTPTSRPATSEVQLRVRAASTLEPSRRALYNGDSVVLRGRLLGRPIPSTGKLVTVQAWTSRGWLTFGTTRGRARDGKWSYRYTFTGTTTTSRYRFRALISREESYPYVTGSSPTRAVVVRGST
jgi:hypothetical protein